MNALVDGQPQVGNVRAPLLVQEDISRLQVAMNIVLAVSERDRLRDGCHQLGSLLGGQQANQVVPGAIVWLAGSFVVSLVLAAAGAFAGAKTKPANTAAVNWVNICAIISVVATLLLLVAGGLVTSYDAGLAVVDWPNSFGYNMFLYPLSKMAGGIYYEHAHRLFGTLVGLCTLVLAVQIWLHDKRRWAGSVMKS